MCLMLFAEATDVTKHAFSISAVTFRGKRGTDKECDTTTSSTFTRKMLLLTRSFPIYFSHIDTLAVYVPCTFWVLFSPLAFEESPFS